MNLNFSQQPIVCSTSHPKEYRKQEPKSVHVASRTNFYYLNETKSMNAQVKFPFRLRSTPFPFAFCCVCVEERSRSVFCFVTLPFCCVCIPFRCVCIPFRCICVPLCSFPWRLRSIAPLHDFPQAPPFTYSRTEMYGLYAIIH